MPKKPLVVFDLETTGKDLELDRVVQIAMVKITPGEENETYTTYVNPQGREIHPEAAAVHGIDMELIEKEDAPAFSKIAEEVKEFIGDHALGGFNIRAFDIPMLMNEYIHSGMGYSWITQRPIIDARTLWLSREPRTLEGALRYFAGEEIENAHDAGADTDATATVIAKELEKFGLEDCTWEEVEAAEDPEGLHKGVIGSKSRLRIDGDKLIMEFGKYRGMDIVECAKKHHDYLEWILKNNFELTLKHIIRKLLKKLYPDWLDQSIGRS